MDEIFVFGSNLAGRHGKGAALHAKQFYAAEYGVGIGRTGNSYAIPTKDHNLRVLAIFQIKEYVDEFISYARNNPNLQFRVTRVGCGLAGYTDEQMVPLFLDCPSNCILPKEWVKILTLKMNKV